MPKEVLQAILTGGLDKIHEAGALLVGGHSVDDTELKYGLSVTGVVHPEKVLTNGGARVGDRLILTKPLGTGVIATAMKGRLASPEAEAEAIRVMTTLNRLPAACLETWRCTPSPTSPASDFWATPWKWRPPVTSRSPSSPIRCRCWPRPGNMPPWGWCRAAVSPTAGSANKHLQVAAGPRSPAR